MIILLQRGVAFNALLEPLLGNLAVGNINNLRNENKGD